MEQSPPLEKRTFTWFLLFVGFASLFGWLAMNAILLTKFTNSRHFADLSATLGTILFGLISSSFYVVLGVVAFVWAHRRLKRTANKEGLVSKSVLPAVILTPLWGFVGIIVMMMTPYAFAHVRQLVVGPNVVQSLDSSDGVYHAFVVDKPSIDGPNHSLYVKTLATGRLDYVTSLPEDVDYAKDILWSPHNDIVVFKTHFKVIGYMPEYDRRHEVVLGGERRSRGNGTFWVSYNNVKKVTGIDFPEPQQMSVQLEGEDQPQLFIFEPHASSKTRQTACCQR